jgi:hypothetical protein
MRYAVVKEIEEFLRRVSGYYYRDTEDPAELMAKYEGEARDLLRTLMDEEL